MKRYKIIQGDNLAAMRGMPDNSVDSIVTDPPYGLSFMGKKWDYDVPSIETWRECLRVLKPGGHLLAFAGTRTQHRMAVRIEDAGFEIRDMIAWVYGTGFPKSHNVSKAIDKAAGAERGVVGLSSVTGSRKSAFAEEMSSSPSGFYGDAKINYTTAPATDDAKRWDGWGTALKPALEPITVARKQFKVAVAANVLRHGTGALNIDGCRVETKDVLKNMSGSAMLCGTSDGWDRPWKSDPEALKRRKERADKAIQKANELGRWPANLIHDGSEEVLALFPITKSGKAAAGGHKRKDSLDYQSNVNYADRSENAGQLYGDSGSAARYFYCAKASKRDRDEGLEGLEGLEQGVGALRDGGRPSGLRKNNHPTVKPTDLMRYLCRLVTPPGGVVLDPFCGSGSTGKAALLEGFQFVGLELDPAYVQIAEARLAHAVRAREAFDRP